MAVCDRNLFTEEWQETHLGVKYETHNNDEQISLTSNNADETEKLNLYELVKGPMFYDLRGKYVTPPITVKRLPEFSENFFMFGKPEKDETVDEFLNRKINQFVSCDLSDTEFNKLANYCSVDHLITGKELFASTEYPCPRVVCEEITKREPVDGSVKENTANLVTTLKRKMLSERKGEELIMHKRLKYRGVHFINIKKPNPSNSILSAAALEPGKDMLFRIRVYKANFYNPRDFIANSNPWKRPVAFKMEITLCGKNNLAQLRDLITCPNDMGTRLDVSENPDAAPPTSAKEIFPSGYLFINNVFYTDDRPACSDLTGVVREWAASRGLGEFPVKSMTKTTLEDMVLRLGHPEVYVHQGCCEHLFTFSDIRLIDYGDSLSADTYQCHTAIAGTNSINCTICSIHIAKWLVTDCKTVPFDPAFFCETCFKMYLYKDGRKIGDFKAYPFKGNDISTKHLKIL